MIVKDSMVLIHLAKMSLLEYCCLYFSPVIIPELVHKEILAGGKKDMLDVKVIKNVIDKGKISVIKIKNNKFLKKANEFDIQGGEAEAVALYWQEKADFLATDDDNVRKKSLILGLSIVGTPALILKLFKEKIIEKEKFKESLFELKNIGWFNSSVIDKVLMEGLK